MEISHTLQGSAWKRLDKMEIMIKFPEGMPTELLLVGIFSSV